MKIPDSNIRNMLKAISEGNHVLNETIRVYKETESQCPDCGYDPIRKESTDSNCVTCEGKGSIITLSYDQISASIETSEDFKYRYGHTGTLVQGQISCTIDSLELKTVLNSTNQYDLDDYPQVRAFVQQYAYIMWKGAKYKVEGFQPNALQGTLYEIALTLSLIG